MTLEWNLTLIKTCKQDKMGWICGNCESSGCYNDTGRCTHYYLSDLQIKATEIITKTQLRDVQRFQSGDNPNYLEYKYVFRTDDSKFSIYVTMDEVNQKVKYVEFLGKVKAEWIKQLSEIWGPE